MFPTSVRAASRGSCVSVSSVITYLIEPRMETSPTISEKAEMAEKAKNAGVGIGMFVAAGALAFFAVGTLIACAVLGLANAVPAWLAALIVAVALLVVAGVLGLIGKTMLSKASTPVKATESIKADIAAVREGLGHERS